jgi:hypothetical protein
MIYTLGITFTPDMIEDMIGYVGDVFSDMSNLILLIVGVGLGLIVVGAIISALRH